MHFLIPDALLSAYMDVSWRRG